MLDLILRGGTVVDGTGENERTADVGVADGRIAEVGKVVGPARREIDTNGALITPGFVDVHAHYDGQATWDPHLAPSAWHGVTTVVMGNCGVGFAPCRPEDRGRLVELMEGVEDIPGTALHEGLPWDWESFPEYLDSLAARPRDVDVGVLVPHGAVRLFVMGERAARREAASDDEIAQMGEIVRAGVEAGAFGFSTSRTLNHRTSTGDPTPTLGAAGRELIGIADAMRAAGRGAFEVVSDYEDVDAEFEIFRAIAKAGARTFVSLNQNKKGGYLAVLDRVTQAAEEGLPISAQVAARPIGVLFGVDATLTPFIQNPAWWEIAQDRESKIAALADPDFRARLRAGAEDPDHAFGSYDKFFPVGDHPEYEPGPEKSVAAIAAREERHPVDVLCDALLANDGKGIVYYPIFNYDDGDLESQRHLLEHPHTLVGLADGGAHAGIICDGSFPTTMLAHWGRDRSRGPKLALPWLVKAQTADTAAAYGLTDRGRIEPGLRADLNVIDFANLACRRPEIVADLPAGGRRFLQKADGYLATIVAGQVTYENGQPTGALPGQLVRSA